MAKKKKKTKSKAKGSGFSIGSIFNRGLLIVLLCIALSAALGYGIYYFFLNSRFFAVKEIVVNREGNYSLEEARKKVEKLYMGRNIFTVDLKQISDMIAVNFPHLKRSEVRRVMPDRLEIDFIVRTPVAVLDVGKGLVLDSEGVVLSDISDRSALINIRGASFFLRAPTAGSRIKTRAILQALSLIDVLRERNIARQYEVEYIDVKDRNNLILNINGVLVKMGNDGFAVKINSLKRILRDPDLDFKDIKYIDLRFEDPVISPR